MRKVRGSRAPAAARWMIPGTGRELRGSRNWAMRLRLSSVGARPGRDRFDVPGERVEVNRAVVEAHLARPPDPDQRVLQPVLVVTLREVLACVRPTALGAMCGGLNGR